MSGILFSNVNILDASGKDPYPGQVLVEGNRITAVSHNGEDLSLAGPAVHAGGGAAPRQPGGRVAAVPPAGGRAPPARAARAAQLL